jgi:hypothetical protein
MHVSLNTINLLPADGSFPTTSQAGLRSRDVSQAPAPNPADVDARPLVEINFAPDRGASGPEPQALSTPVEISTLAGQQTTTRRYYAVAEAMRRLIAGATISMAVLLAVLA